MAYREQAAKKGVEVVHYRPMHPLGTAAIVGLILLLAGFTLSQAATYARSVRFDCERGGAHTCVVTRDYGLFATEDRLPINRIAEIPITTHRGKNSTSYGVGVVMTDRANVALIRPTTRARAELVKSGVELVIHDRPGKSGLPVQDGSPIAAFFMTLFGLGLGSLSFLMLQTARLDFDLDRSTIRYTRFRFPLRPVRRTFKLDEVHGARVVSRVGSKGRTYYETTLTLDGEVLALVSGGGGSEARHEETAQRINVVLERMREGS